MIAIIVSRKIVGSGEGVFKIHRTDSGAEEIFRTKFSLSERTLVCKVILISESGCLSIVDLGKRSLAVCVLEGKASSDVIHVTCCLIIARYGQNQSFKDLYCVDEIEVRVDRTCVIRTTVERDERRCGA